MILKSGRDWEPDPIDVTLWQSAYPGIDVKQELAKMAAWCDAQPAYKRKTERGIKRFCVNWLSRARPQSSTSTRHRSLQEDLTDTSWAS
jgi:hypothetical protein